MAVCNDLRLGGSLSASGITGGLSINSTAIGVYDWSGIFGHAGYTTSPLQVNGRPGSYFAGDMLGRSRFPLLRIQLTREGPNVVLVEPTEEEQLWANTDDFLTLLADPDGQYLEYDMPDGEMRFALVRAIDAAVVNQVTSRRRVAVPLITDWPYWKKGGAQSSQTINGVDNLNNLGRVTVYDPVLTFSGAGTITHSTEGWSIEATAGSFPLVVNLGTRTVTQGGVAATNRIRRDSRDWGWFPAGNNSILTDVSIGITWRIQYV